MLYLKVETWESVEGAGYQAVLKDLDTPDGPELLLLSRGAVPPGRPEQKIRDLLDETARRAIEQLWLSHMSRQEGE